ncbi:MAG TPA: hypothetical protein VJS15_10600, partial [Allosphingosinicella sp.]|nr:hypothetical protein [Allosphingosinicella sp.]
EAARRERAEADAVVREIMGENQTFRAAFEERSAARSAERISGTIRIRFETDAAERVTRRTKVTELVIEGPGQRRETRTTTETVERRLVSGPAR